MTDDAATQSRTISVNEYVWERLLWQFERSLRHMEDGRRKTDVHGADVVGSAALMLKKITSDDERAPSDHAIRFHDWLRARADERRRNPDQQNQADVLDVVYLAFWENVMDRPKADGAAIPVYYAQAADDPAELPGIAPIIQGPPAVEKEAQSDKAWGEGQYGSAALWEEARKIADECFDHDTELGTRDSLNRKNKRGEYVGGYAFRVMEIMQKRKIHGPRGRIDNAGTIAREALQGSKWWGKKAK
jgi:hypothetical protein